MADDVKPWEILIRAAELINNGTEKYCCMAIDKAVLDFLLSDPLRGLWQSTYDCVSSAFRRMSSRDDLYPMNPWWPNLSEKSKTERVLALLFAAEISKDEWK